MTSNQYDDAIREGEPPVVPSSPSFKQPAPKTTRRHLLLLLALLLTCAASAMAIWYVVVKIEENSADAAGRILGRWEMIEDREHRWQKPPTETIEFTQGGGIVLRMNGKVEMEGRFRITEGKVILTHLDGQTPMGDLLTIKRLTADSLVLTSKMGKDSEFVRK